VQAGVASSGGEVLVMLTCKEVRRTKGAVAAQSRGNCCLRCVLAEDRRELRELVSLSKSSRDLTLCCSTLRAVADGGVCAVQPGEVVRQCSWKWDVLQQRSSLSCGIAAEKSVCRLDL
jgi:hypothetical protein